MTLIAACAFTTSAFGSAANADEVQHVTDLRGQPTTGVHAGDETLGRSAKVRSVAAAVSAVRYLAVSPSPNVTPTTTATTTATATATASFAVANASSTSTATTKASPTATATATHAAKATHTSTATATGTATMTAPAVPSSNAQFTVPAACRPESQPAAIHATSGSISVGWRSLSRRRRALQNDDLGDGDDSTGDDPYSTTIDPLPSPAPGPGPYLPAGLTCIWGIDAGGDQRVAVDIKWAHIGYNPLPELGGGGDGSGAAGGSDSSDAYGCEQTESGEGVTSFLQLWDGPLPDSDGNDDAQPWERVASVVCWYEPSVSSAAATAAAAAAPSTAPLSSRLRLLSSWPPPALVSYTSNTTLLYIVMVIGEEDVDIATGFQLDFNVVAAAAPTKQPVPNYNCTMSDWSAWGSCSVECGGGVATRTRSVAIQQSGTGTCPFPLEETKACNQQTCGPAVQDVDCSLSDWGPWGPCEVAPGAGGGCGAGNQTRTRYIVTPASGNGTPCPPPSAMIASQTCTVPCVIPACLAGQRPVKPTTLSGVIGIGTKAGSLNPAHTKGSGTCGWSIDPAAAGWNPVTQGGQAVVNLTLKWINIPTSQGCASQYLQIRYTSSGEAAFAKICGAALPDTLVQQSHGIIISRPGDGLTIDLITNDNDTDASIGFEASYVITAASGSSGGGDGPIPRPAVDSHAATLTLHGTSAWSTGKWSPAQIIALARTDLATAAGVGEYRFTGFIYTAASRQLVVQVVPPLAMPPSSVSSSAGLEGAVGEGRQLQAEPSAYAILDGLYAQLSVSTSPLRRGTVTSTLDTSVFQVLWASPAAIGFTPSAVMIPVPYQRPSGFPTPTYSSQLTIRNTGGSALIIPSASFTYSNNGDAGSPPYGTALLSLQQGAIPATIAPNGQKVISITVDGSKIPPGAVVTAFAVLQLEHSDPTGPHAVGVSIVITGAPQPSSVPGPNNGDGSIGSLMSSQAFKYGMGAGVAALVGSVVFLACSWCWCCRVNGEGVTLCSKYCFRRGAGDRKFKPGGSGQSKGGSGSGSGSGSSKGGKGGKGTGSGGDGSGGKKSTKSGDHVQIDLDSDDEDGAGGDDSGSDGGGRGRKGGKGRGGGGNRRGGNDSGSSGGEDDEEGEGRGLHNNSNRKDKDRRKQPSSSKRDGGKGMGNVNNANIIDDDGSGFGLELSSLSSGNNSRRNQQQQGPHDNANDGDITAGSSTSIGRDGQLRGVGPFGAASSSSSASGAGIGGLMLGGVGSANGGGVTTITSGGGAGSSGLFGGLSLGGVALASGAAAGGFGAASSNNSSMGTTGNGGGLALKSKPVLKASEFERHWSSLVTVELWGATLANRPADGELEKSLSTRHIACMASGVVGGVSKYYFYGQAVSPEDTTIGSIGGPGSTSSTNLAIAEVSLPANSKRISAVIKASNPSLGLVFTEQFKAGVKATGLVVAAN